MTARDVLIQGIGVVGILAGVVSFQCNRHSRALLFKTMDEFCFGLQYLLLGGWSGMILNFLGCFRNLLFTRLGKREDLRALGRARIGFGILFGGLGLAFWEGPISILIVFAKVLSTLAYGTTNMKHMRLMIFLTCICWLSYNVWIGSLAGALSDLFTLGSVVVGMVRYDVKRKAEKDL